MFNDENNIKNTTQVKIDLPNILNDYLNDSCKKFNVSKKSYIIMLIRDDAIKHGVEL